MEDILFVAARFWSKVQKGSDCWIWIGGTTRGRGAFLFDGAPVAVERVAWILLYGERPPRDQYVRRTCGNTFCVKPEHLVKIAAGGPREESAPSTVRELLGRANARQFSPHSRWKGTLEERFWSKVNKLPGENACWEWQGCIIKALGYGQIAFNGRRENAHRVSWMLDHPDEPILRFEDHICHTCDNRRCVRPSHLWRGDAKQNGQDCSAKGRKPKPNLGNFGDASPASKLTEESVRCLFRLRAQGWTQMKLAAEFNIHQTQVSNILSGKQWPHMQGCA